MYTQQLKGKKRISFHQLEITSKSEEHCLADVRNKKNTEEKEEIFLKLKFLQC